jgi:hypothetical protein
MGYETWWLVKAWNLLGNCVNRVQTFTENPTEGSGQVGHARGRMDYREAMD